MSAYVADGGDGGCDRCGVAEDEWATYSAGDCLDATLDVDAGDVS